MVAEAGFERCDLQVMGLTSYRAALLRDVVLTSLLNIKPFFKGKMKELYIWLKYLLIQFLIYFFLVFENCSFNNTAAL